MAELQAPGPARRPPVHVVVVQRRADLQPVGDRHAVDLDQQVAREVGHDVEGDVAVDPAQCGQRENRLPSLPRASRGVEERRGAEALELGPELTEVVDVAVAGDA